MTAINYTQEDRRLSLDTPLGPDVLIATAFNGREELSRLSFFHLQLVSETADIDPTSIVGKNITLNVPLPDGSPRYFNGYVSRFACRGSDDRLTHYRAEVVPWLWFLTRSTSCRIFQTKSVVDIISQVFSALKFTDFEISEIKNTHPQREYCVQYRESDFNFVSRLMEEEGIFYYFHHEEGKHTLVLSDQTGGYKDCTESKVTFSANLSEPDPLDLITSWEHRFEYRSGACTHRDYNFETPANDLTATKKTVSHFDDVAKFELYDYPGKYDKKPDGDSLAKLRMEEQEVATEVVAGGSRCRSFGPGGKFTLSGHHLAGEENKGYVITSIEHSVSESGSYQSGGASAEIDYRNNFECIPDTVVFRPERTTAKPFIRGAQTAVVCGPAGQEIYVDKYGRIKVQFFWDRVGMRDEKSSCWIRVAQVWAGNKWGAFHWPRISQEVVVSFLDGDPDRPLITGSVYNAERMPPYALPDEKTKSGIKSDSSIGGGGFNEIRFEDKKDSEQIFIHAQKNQDVRIKNDCFEWIGNEQHLIVIKNQFEEVDGNKNMYVKGDHLIKIDGNLGSAIKGDRAAKIDGKENLTVSGDRMVHAKGDDNLEVTGNLNQKVGAKLSLTVGGDLHQKADGAIASVAGTTVHIKGGASVVIEAGSDLTLKVGGNFVNIGPSGVSIFGSLVNINSGGAAGAGSGASPTSPASPVDPDAAAAPKCADDAVSGAAELAAVPVNQMGPVATALHQAAQNATPFCQLPCPICAAAKGSASAATELPDDQADDSQDMSDNHDDGDGLDVSDGESDIDTYLADDTPDREES